ncbi:GNAT family N-acetyltransferase [Streptomyces sp. NPDC047072]|uniref:GNAT family N-acetyltransferase n=1 Tax=Streptomyces sp. NPDC047072 TaxID=3154809 RepID=UPI0033CDED93
MLTMRPATPEDRGALAAMIQARADWMKARKLPNWRCWGEHVHELAATCSGRYGDMWVLTENNDRILGCTTILTVGAPWGWTGSEAEDPAYYLTATVTDPAERHRKLGALISDWAVDHAAHQNIAYVRQDCTSPALAAYYQTQQFTLIRRIDSPGISTMYAMERKSQKIPGLAERLRGEESGEVIARKVPTHPKTQNTAMECARS